MKKIIPIIIIIALIIIGGFIFIFTRHTHTFSEATCETAPTCECGEINGAPLGHNWQDVTCIEAMTCSVCGITEGEPLNHNWLDATEDSPKTCELCGATDGEPLAKLGTVDGYEAPIEDTNTDEGSTGSADGIPEDKYQGDIPEPSGKMNTDLTELDRMLADGEISQELYDMLKPEIEKALEEMKNKPTPTNPTLDIEDPLADKPKHDPSQDGQHVFDPNKELPPELQGNPFN